MTEINNELIRRILDSITIVEGKAAIKGASNYLDFQRSFSLLLSGLMSDTSFQRRLRRLRYFFGDINDDLLFGADFMSIFVNLKQNNEYCFVQFKERLEKKLDDIKSGIKVQKFELFYPINIITDEKINSFKFQDIEIKVLDYSEIKEILENKDLSEKTRIKDFKKSKYKYIYVSIWARNIAYAHENGTSYVNLILGLIAKSQIHGISNIVMIGSIEPLMKLKLSHVFIFRENIFLKHYPYFENNLDEIKLLRKESIDEINNFIGLIQNANKEVEYIIFRAINCYYMGLMEKSINYSFLNFWTALEILCLKDKGVREYEIIRRLKSIFIKLQPLEEHKIDRLYSLRNNLVHTADYDKINQYDRDLLKSYVEELIDFFVCDLSKYNASEINSIFYFLQKNDADLINDKKIIDLVINFRRQNSKSH